MDVVSPFLRYSSCSVQRSDHQHSANRVFFTTTSLSSSIVDPLTYSVQQTPQRTLAMPLVDKLRTNSQDPSGDDRLGLWDPSLKQQRKGTLKKVLIAFLLITISMWLFLPVYFGSYYRQTENTYRLTTLILDLDSAASTLSSTLSSSLPNAQTQPYTAILGPAITQSARTYLTEVAPLTNSTTWALGYTFPTDEQLSEFSLPYRNNQGEIGYTPGVDPEEWAKEKVHGQTYWAVVLVRGNATLLALEALAGRVDSYDPMGSVAIIYTESRNFFTSNQYVSTQTVELVTAASNQAGSTLIDNYLESTNDAAAVADTASAGGGAGRMVLTRPFGYSEYNLAPFDQLAGEAATTAGAIYLIIFVFFFTPIWTGVYSTVRSGLTLGSDLVLTILANLGWYFWISLHYSLLSLAFGVTFTRARGYGGFPLYWLMNFVTMMALGFPMQFFFEILGQPYFPFFLVFWVIINVSVAFLDIADMDPFYSYGFAFPVWNNVDAAKHLFFATKSHLVQNFAVNLAWALISAFLLACLVFHRRSKETRSAWEAHRKELHPPKRQMRLVL
ncbi:hypothetical protein HD553DRAFT_315155 [Filobasidium floriforme]|uniref:uncharacterized protein n=1 Tax=Filobasidium floriforme TaxID=5210 RepID=UPI001E8E8DBB|nr:uncharacterized protein HD553DRAFT_315155 [Filobasidium floriforme]KAH8081901.1 hypothetical protein HD553DRAFT_315155 [Filobasidium floriforme]